MFMSLIFLGVVVCCCCCFFCLFVSLTPPAQLKSPPLTIFLMIYVILMS